MPVRKADGAKNTYLSISASSNLNLLKVAQAKKKGLFGGLFLCLRKVGLRVEFFVVCFLCVFWCVVWRNWPECC